MTFEKAIQLLREFYYEKNGKESTIEFLKIIVQELEKSNE